MDYVRRRLILAAPALAIGAAAAPREVFPQALSEPKQGSVADGAHNETSRIAEPGNAAAGAPADRFKQLKEAFVDQTIAISRAALDQDSVREAMAWQGEFPQSALFRAVDVPIAPAHLDDTKYDVSELRRKYPVQLGLSGTISASSRRHVPTRVIPAIDKDRDAQFKKDGYLSANYGNCFYWNTSDTIVTTEHLAQIFPDSAKSLRHDALDISVAKASAQYVSRSPDQIITDDPQVTDDDIHGSLVCIVGRDPDQLSDLDGVKVYPGIAVKMTREFIAGILSEIPPTGRRGMPPHEYQRFIANVRRRMDNAYMIRLPPGEGRAYPDQDSDLPCQGMSASPVFGFIRGTYRMVGIFFSAMSLEDAQRRRDVDVAFFHPISAIRALAADSASHWTLR